MKAAQLRALIGKEIEWEYAHDHHRGTYLLRRAVITDVNGRNVAVDSGGMTDWVYSERLINLREVKPNAN